MASRRLPPLFLRESGQREVFCGCTSIVWLHRRNADAFFLVVAPATVPHPWSVGGRGEMNFRRTPFRHAIPRERDLAGLWPDANEELDRVVGDLLERRLRESAPCFWWGPALPEVIKLDPGQGGRAQYQPALPRPGAGGELSGQRQSRPTFTSRGRTAP